MEKQTMLTIKSTPKGFRVNGGKVIFKNRLTTEVQTVVANLADKIINPDELAKIYGTIANDTSKGHVRKLRRLLRSQGLNALAGLKKVA